MSAAAIRFYESEGVLPEARRLQSGYRHYTVEDVDLVRFVSRLRALEFPLNKSLLAFLAGGIFPDDGGQFLSGVALLGLEGWLLVGSRAAVDVERTNDKALSWPHATLIRGSRVG